MFNNILIKLFFVFIIVIYITNSSCSENHDKTTSILNENISSSLFKSGWDKDSINSYLAYKIDVFQQIENENPIQIENEIILLEKIGKYPEILKLIVKYPFLDECLEGSEALDTIEKTLIEDEYHDTIVDLYQLCSSSKEIDNLSFALENNRELICRLIEKGLEGSEEIFIFPRDNTVIKDYEIWLREVLNSYIGESEENLDKIIQVILIQGPSIRQRFKNDSDFQQKFLYDLWPKFKLLVTKKPDFFEYYILEPKIWDMLETKNGTELLNSYGITVIDLFIGPKAYPRDLHNTISQILLHGDIKTVEAIQAYSANPIFNQLLRRQLSPTTLAAAISKIYDEGPKYPAKLSYYNSLDEIALAKEVGSISNSLESAVFVGGITTLCSKMKDGRKIDFTDFYSAGENVFDIASIATLAPMISKSAIKFTGKSILKNIKEIKINKIDVNTYPKKYSYPLKTNKLQNIEVNSSRAKNEFIRIRKPINSEYAGKKYPLEKLSSKLQTKYPNSVNFTKDGYPDFSDYASKEVKIPNLTGDYYEDFSKANKAAGFDNTPPGYTWHHHQDGITMQLVPSDLHAAIRHTGGASKLRD